MWNVFPDAILLCISTWNGVIGSKIHKTTFGYTPSSHRIECCRILHCGALWLRRIKINLQHFYKITGNRMRLPAPHVWNIYCSAQLCTAFTVSVPLMKMTLGNKFFITENSPYGISNPKLIRLIIAAFTTLKIKISGILLHMYKPRTQIKRPYESELVYWLDIKWSQANITPIVSSWLSIHGSFIRIAKNLHWYKSI